MCEYALTVAPRAVEEKANRTAKATKAVRTFSSFEEGFGKLRPPYTLHNTWDVSHVLEREREGITRSALEEIDL